MTKPVTQGEIRPYVAALHGQIKTTSLKVAEHFAKRHDDVLKRIRKIECSEDFRLRNFAETVIERPNPSGGSLIRSPAFEMTKDGFLILVMGYTGPVAMKIKEAYIAEFNRMEAALRSGAAALPSTERAWVPRASLKTRNISFWPPKIRDYLKDKPRATLEAIAREALGIEPDKYDLWKIGDILYALGWTSEKQETAVTQRTEPLALDGRFLMRFESGRVVESTPVPSEAVVVHGADLAKLWDGLVADHGRAVNRLATFCKDLELLPFLDGPGGKKTDRSP